MAEQLDSRQIIWVRYTWDLTSPPPNLTVPDGYSVRTGELGEHNSLANVAIASYASDPAWDSLLSGIRERLERRVEADRRVYPKFGSIREEGVKRNYLDGPSA